MWNGCAIRMGRENRGQSPGPYAVGEGESSSLAGHRRRPAMAPFGTVGRSAGLRLVWTRTYMCR